MQICDVLVFLRWCGLGVLEQKARRKGKFEMIRAEASYEASPCTRCQGGVHRVSSAAVVVKEHVEIKIHTTPAEDFW